MHWTAPCVHELFNKYPTQMYCGLWSSEPPPPPSYATILCPEQSCVLPLLSCHLVIPVSRLSCIMCCSSRLAMPTTLVHHQRSWDLLLSLWRDRSPHDSCAVHSWVGCSFSRHHQYPQELWHQFDQLYRLGTRSAGVRSADRSTPARSLAVWVRLARATVFLCRASQTDKLLSILAKRSWWWGKATWNVIWDIFETVASIA